MTPFVKIGASLDPDAFTVEPQIEAVESQHYLQGLEQRPPKRVVAVERSDIPSRKHWRLRVRAARLRKREQPLNVIVVEFELVEIEFLDVG